MEVSLEQGKIPRLARCPKTAAAHCRLAVLNGHKIRTLRKLRERGMDWTPATLPRVAQDTWSTLVTLGYVEERREGEDRRRRFLRLTEKGRRAAD